MSQIKLFRVDAEYIECAKAFDFQIAEKECLRQFDEWREKEKPVILACKFGRKHGYAIEEDPHYWYIQVLFDTGGTK